MQKNFRFTLVLLLLISIWANLSTPMVQDVQAKPASQVATNVVISEFRFRGDGGGNDEFIELYNPTINPIDISGWFIRGSNNAGATSTRATIPASTILQSGQYYLIAHTGYSGATTANLTYGTGITDDGGVAVTLADTVTIIDQAGLSAVSAYKEGTQQTSLTATIDQGYERKTGGLLDSCIDTNDNFADFQLISSNPQNLSSPKSLCGISSDLSLTQSVDNATQSVGLNVVFTITVSNASGYDDATNVTVRSLLPAGLTYVSDTGAGAYNNATGIWTIGTLTNGTNAILNITATVATAGPKVNAAEVWSADQFDIDSTPANTVTTEDDYDDVTVTPPGPAPTLSITNTVNNATPNIGSNVVFTINVSNASGTNATGAVVNAGLPVGLDYVSSSSGTYVVGTRTLTWNIGNLANSSNTTVTITAIVLSPSLMTLSATSSAAGFGTSSANATVTPIASTQANLRLEQTWKRSPFASDTAILELKVTNQDVANVATNVQVRSLLPTGLTYVSHTSGQNYNSSTGIWAVGTILGSGVATLEITVKVSASGSSTSNFVEIWQVDQFDPNSTPGNGDVGEDDQDTDEVLVADLSLTQTSDIAGSNAVFTLKVTNSGPDDATNISVDNTKLHLPANYIYVSHAGSGSYNSTTGVWTIGNLADGATATLVVTTTIVSPDENWAEVITVTEVDPDSLPNNDSRKEDDDAASPSADLSLTQTIFNPIPYKNSDINSTIIFRITLTNSGYANATGVEIKDLLPAGLTYVSHTSGQTYNKSSGIWAVGNLARNTSTFLDITAKVTSFGIRTNWAEVWKANQSDPDSDPGDSSTTSDDDASTTITSYRSVVINEVAWSGTLASPEDEWLELYNPSNADITITGWKIRKNSCGASGTDYIVLSGKISKGGYFLLERGNTATDNTTISNISANQIYYSTPLLIDSGETLYLCDNFNNFIDTANQQGFGSSSNPWPKGSGSPTYSSMERKDNATEIDASWISNNGVTKNGLSANGKAIYGTPGKKNSTLLSATSTPKVTPTTPSTATPAIAPRPIINEILARPGFDWNQDGKIDVFDEYIEIKNLTAIDITLKGWKLDKANSTSFALPDITLRPNERVVFYSLETNLLLSDGGETVRLINPSGKIYDAFTYTVAKTEDQSFCRLPDGNVYNGWFEDCTPTPTQSNTREGKVPTSPNGNNQSPVCELPDTIPADFFFAECRAYGASIWNPLYWEQVYKIFVPSNISKWDSYFE